MLEGTASNLRVRLTNLGLSDEAIHAAWPEWWSEDADASDSARAELRFSLSRKLGLDPQSLLEDGQPRFLWSDIARFKHLTNECDSEKAALSSFGVAIGNLLASAAAPQTTKTVLGLPASKLRNAILNDVPFLGLLELISVCWSFGIPVIHLRISPLTRRRMSAMSVQIGVCPSILIGKDFLYPPTVAFYIAHELAHIALGHLRCKGFLVDFHRSDLADSSTDPEERAADRYALELLTGSSQPLALGSTRGPSSRGLATSAIKSTKHFATEPGILALCFGYSNKQWAIVNAAMKNIYAAKKHVWNEINGIAANQLTLENISEDSRTYLMRILGKVDTREIGH